MMDRRFGLPESGLALLWGMLSIPVLAATDKPQQPGAEEMLRVPVSGNPINNDQPINMPANPYADDRNAVVQGQALFHSMNCDGCHAPEGGGGMGPPLSDNQWIYGRAPAQVYLSIAQGRPQGMPAWGHVMPPASIWNIVRYIESLNDQVAASRKVDNRAAEKMQ